MEQPHEVDAVLPQHEVDDVLWTKLHAPTRPASFVERPRLRDRLQEGFHRGDLTLVSAPAGFGKSMLLADACGSSGRATAWLSLDEGDNDPVRFWRHVAAALDQAIGDSASCGRRVEQAIRTDPAHHGVSVVTAVQHGVPAGGADVVLVLDDYHVVVDRALHESVRYLLDHAPPRTVVAIATRADPPLQLARWRAQGRLSEVREADLRFTAEEGGRLLRVVAGADLTDGVVSALSSRTEGWAAGLHLAGLSLGGVADVDAFALAFGGQHRFVVDYLTEEVLDHQDPSVRDFLLATSLLDRLSGPLCDAVTGRDDCQEMLEAIEHANLFLVPLDDVRGWWRYHQLFRDLLRARLQQQPAETVHRLHRRAAAWHAANRNVNEAIRHLLAVDDPEAAARLIERYADELLLRREGASLQRWFDQLPRGLLDSRRLALAQARMAVYGGQVREAERLLDLADTMAGQETEADFQPSVGDAASPLAATDPMAALLRAFVAHMRGDADEAVRLATVVLGEVDDGGSTLALIATWHLATAPFLRGSVRTAQPALRSNIADWRAAGESERAAWTARYLAAAQRARGDLDAALATYQDVLDRDAAPDEPSAGVAQVGIAEISYERGDLGAAKVHARLGISLCGEFVYTQALADGLAILAWVQWADGDRRMALQTMSEAVAVAPARDVIDVLNPVPAQHAALSLLVGDVETAARWASDVGLNAATEPTHEREPAHRTLVRLLLAQGDHTGARHQLDRMRALAREQERHGSLVEIDVLSAVALAAAGDEPGALAAMASAVIGGAAPGYHRVFVDQVGPVPALLAELERVPDPRLTSEHRSHLSSLLVRLGGGGATAAQTALVVAPTPREIEVLRLLAAGMQNKQIAAELYVSQNTVKKHVAHLFDKLTVTTRTAAVTRARELGLLT